MNKTHIILYTLITLLIPSILYSMDYKGKYHKFAIEHFQKTSTNSSFPIDDRPAQPISSLAINQDNTSIISGSYDAYTSVQVRDAHTLQLTHNIMYHSAPILCVEFLNENKLAAGTQDGLIMLYNDKSHHSLDILRGHTDSVMSLSYNKNPNTPLLVSGSHDKMIKVWDLKTNRCLYCVYHTDSTSYSRLNCVAIRTRPFQNNQLTPLIISGATEGTLNIWTHSINDPYIPQAQKIITIKNNCDINSLTFLPNHLLLVAAAKIQKSFEQGTCEVYNPETGKLHSTLKPINNRSRISGASTCQTKDNAIIVAGRFLEDSSIGIWDITNNKQYHLKAPSAYHQNICILIFAHRDKLLLFYDTEDDSNSSIHSMIKRKKIKLTDTTEEIQ